MVLIRIIQRFTNRFKQKPTELGRWSFLENDDALQKRIDMANIDHCGPCSFKQISKEKNDKFNISTGRTDETKSK